MPMDDTVKQRFMADPKAVLAEHGMPVPDDIDVNVVENTDSTVHITMPKLPSGGMDLSDEELSDAAGGNRLQRAETLRSHCNLCFW